MARTKALAQKANKANNDLRPKKNIKGPNKSQKTDKSTKAMTNEEVVSQGIKKHKHRPGSIALREIRKYQKNTDLVIRKLPFQRAVRSIAQSLGDTRFQSRALKAIQECAEMYLVNLFCDSQLCALHANRITVYEKDMRLAKRIKGDRNGELGESW